MERDGGVGDGGEAASRVSSASQRSRRSRTRGWDAEGPRTRRIGVYLSEAEHADVVAVSERLGMKPGALLGEIAVRHARGWLDPPPADMRAVVAELVAQRPYLTRAGTLLNQLTKVANAQGTLPEDVGEQLAVVRRLLETLTEQVETSESQAVARTKAAR